MGNALALFFLFALIGAAAKSGSGFLVVVLSLVIIAAVIDRD